MPNYKMATPPTGTHQLWIIKVVLLCFSISQCAFYRTQSKLLSLVFFFRFHVVFSDKCFHFCTSRFSPKRIPNNTTLKRYAPVHACVECRKHIPCWVLSTESGVGALGLLQRQGAGRWFD
jgi:hypothetical protein